MAPIGRACSAFSFVVVAGSGSAIGVAAGRPSKQTLSHGIVAGRIGARA